MDREIFRYIALRADREGFGPQLVGKKEARWLAERGPTATMGILPREGRLNLWA